MPHGLTLTELHKLFTYPHNSDVSKLSKETIQFCLKQLTKRDLIQEKSQIILSPLFNANRKE